jgi:peptidoglycan hydrolase CwlO-like protein
MTQVPNLNDLTAQLAALQAQIDAQKASAREAEKATRAAEREAEKAARVAAQAELDARRSDAVKQILTLLASVGLTPRELRAMLKAEEVAATTVTV